MKLAVTQTINCAHQLPGTELHGHTYRVTAIMRGKLNDGGRVIGFEAFKAHLQAVLAEFDHKQIDSLIGEPATAERFAVVIQRRLALRTSPHVQIRIHVGDDGWVETE